MVEYFGSLSFLIYTKKEEESISAKSEKWDNFDIVFFDEGLGNLKVLKDNTSKFSIPVEQIQNYNGEIK